jgi:hypothetical protein
LKINAKRKFLRPDPYTKTLSHHGIRERLSENFKEGFRSECHSPGMPPRAEYWHIGETPILFFSVTSLMRNGENDDGMKHPADARTYRNCRLS